MRLGSPPVSRSCTTTVIRLSLKCVGALVGPRPVYSLRSRTTRLLMARPCGPVVVGSNWALGIASSVLASLLRAESRERRKEADEIRRATRQSRTSRAGSVGTYVLPAYRSPAGSPASLMRDGVAG